MAVSQHVCVIGGGASGTIAARELQDEGHTFKVFEKRDCIGGLFTAGYDGLMMTSSTAVTLFSGYRMDGDENPRFLTGGEYVKYLNDFADYYDLRKHFVFQSEVVEVKPAPDSEPIGHWDERDTKSFMTPQQYKFLVKYRTHNGEVHVEKFTRIIVATGVHQPSNENMEVLDGYTGESMHSSQFKNTLSPTNMRGKSVLIIGGGESAADIAYEISKDAKKLALSFRSCPGFITPRRVFNSPLIPADHDTTPLRHCLPLWQHPVHNFWDLPLLRTPYPYRPYDAVMFAINETIMKNGLLTSRTYATKTEGFCKAVAENDADIYPGIKSIHGKTVTFVNGDHNDFDILLHCSGYKTRLPYLAQHFPDLTKDVEKTLQCMFKNILHPKYGDAISFVGFVRPQFGSIPPMAEMQCRWLALLFSGRREVPHFCELERVAAIDREILRLTLPKDHQKSSLRNFLTYQEEMAWLIGCGYKIFSWESLFRPLTTFRLACGPINTESYRIDGPHADPERALKVIQNVKLHDWRRIVIQLLFFLWDVFIGYVVGFFIPAFKVQRPLRITSTDSGIRGVLPSLPHDSESCRSSLPVLPDEKFDWDAIASEVSARVKRVKLGLKDGGYKVKNGLQVYSHPMPFQEKI